jgi:hypothetical protein
MPSLLLTALAREKTETLFRDVLARVHVTEIRSICAVHMQRHGLSTVLFLN